MKEETNTQVSGPAAPPPTEGYYTSPHRKVGDWFLGFVGIFMLGTIILLAVGEVLFGLLGEVAGWVVFPLYTGVLLFHILWFFKRKRRFISIGILSGIALVQLAPLIAFGACVYLFVSG